MYLSALGTINNISICTILLAVGFLSAVSVTAQDQKPILTLEPGHPLEREIAVGQEHNYHIQLQAGQYAQIEVEQRGINVLLNVFAPDNKYLFWHDLEYETTGTERAIIVAEAPGEYRLWVAPQGPPNAKNILPGKYLVKIASLHSATEQEKRIFQAQILFAWAIQHGWSNDEKEKAEGIKQAQEWLRLYRHEGDIGAILAILRLLGADAIAQRNFIQSADYHQQMITLVQATGDQRRLGFTLQFISLNYNLVREYQTAVNYKLQELAIWQRLGDYALQASAWKMLGVQYLRLRQIEKSLGALAQRLAIVRELKDAALEADTLQTISNVYAWLKDDEKAFDYLKQAMRVAEGAGAKWIQANLLSELTYYIARQEGYPNAPQLLKKHGNREQEIIAMFEKSRNLYRELNDPFEAEPLSILANWHAKNGRREATLEAVERALQLSQAMNQSYKCQIKVNVAAVYSVLGDLDKAIELQEQAVREFNGDFDGTANILRELANYLRKAGRLAEALERIEECIRIKESLRERLNDQENRTNVSSDIAGAYELYADVLMQTYQQTSEPELVTKAFIATERARARSLLDLLNEARANLRSDVDPALLARETSLQQKLNSITPRPNDPRKEQLLEANKQAINATLNELQKVRAQIRQASPRFAELTEPQPPSLHEIQTQLLDADTILLAYSLGEKRSFLWAITPDSIKGYQLPPRDEIVVATQRVYDLLTIRQHPGKTEKDVQAADAVWQQAADTLQQMLLGQVASQLGTKRLLIVAPEALQYLPFGTLPVPEAFRVSSFESREQSAKSRPLKLETQNQKPLIVDHEIISLPSVSVMMLLRQESQHRQPAAKAVAVLADPVFDANDPRVKHKMLAKLDTKNTAAVATPLTRSLRSFDARAGLVRLLLSRDEAEAISAAVPVTDRFKALDFQASRANAMSEALSQYRIIHFATHGLLNAEHPELSGLVFSLVDENGNPQDGFLRLHEIYNLKLPAELVVLSACQTGLGKEIKGEGLIGLTRGFMYAGAARVVASLWRVDDYATSVLMKKFYRGMLQEKLTAAAALRKAQIEMWQQKQWQSPFYWGAFVLQGEWK